MTHPTLYFNPKDGFYYHLGPAKCNRCESIIEDVFEIYESFSRKQSFIIFICHNCRYTPFLDNPIVTELKKAIITNLLPKGCHPYVPIQPELTQKRDTISLIDAAELSSIKTKDYTIYANRINLDGCQIGADVLRRIQELDSEQTQKQAITYIQNLAAAQPLIEESSVKLLTKQR